MLCRVIPSTGEYLPVIGLGTWQTFDVNPATAHPELSAVLNGLHSAGGRLIDSSPMYGRAEEVVGALAARSALADDFFYATKVWTTGRDEGIRQMEQSFQRMSRPVIDLIQIHNLVDWKTHLPTLRAWKEEGRIRYIGITHYTDASHATLEAILAEESLDFVQFNYSIFSRHAEERLLPAAAHEGVATLINRPLGEGRAFDKVRGKPLPEWAGEYGISSWSTFFLKFIVANPAVTCVIPATSSPEHMVQNAEAASGIPIDEAMRQKMLEVVKNL
jgi:diketogulonate reductase-like aldo/keto reductase